MTLTKFETAALVAKARSNRFGNVSDRLVAGLVEKGLIDAKTRRLTESGAARVEAARRPGSN